MSRTQPAITLPYWLQNLFKVANETLVKSLSRKAQSSWLPNLSQWDSDHLHPLSLVKRKFSKFGLSRKGYAPLELKLVDVVKQKALPEVKVLPNYMRN